MVVADPSIAGKTDVTSDSLSGLAGRQLKSPTLVLVNRSKLAPRNNMRLAAH